MRNLSVKLSLIILFNIILFATFSNVSYALVCDISVTDNRVCADVSTPVEVQGGGMVDVNFFIDADSLDKFRTIWFEIEADGQSYSTYLEKENIELGKVNTIQLNTSWFTGNAVLRLYYNDTPWPSPVAVPIWDEELAHIDFLVRSPATDTGKINIVSINRTDEPGKYHVVLKNSDFSTWRISSFNFALRIEGYEGKDNVKKWPTSPVAYSCNDFEHVLKTPLFQEQIVTCDFSNFQKPGFEGDYKLLLFSGQVSLNDFNRDPISSMVFSTRVVEFSDINLVADTKDFNIGITVFPGAVSGNYSIYALQARNAAAVNSSTPILSDKGAICAFNVGAPGPYSQACSFKNFIGGNYVIAVIGRDGTVRDPRDIVVPASEKDNTCTCAQVLYCSGPRDYERNTLVIGENFCAVGTEPLLDCRNDVSPETCSCTCDGNAYNGGTGPSNDYEGGPIPIRNVNSLAGWAQTGHSFLIALGLVASIFIIPWTFVLMASGNPDKVKQGQEWLVSLIGGLLLLFLSGTLIKIVGTNLLSF